jgi:CRISPR system Cascade subunit CasD
MQEYLILKIEGVLQSWGTHTYEDYRPSNMFPTLSGILGLLAACLGIERRDLKQLQALDNSIELAVRVDRVMMEKRRLMPVKITDFHTVMDARKVDGKMNKYPVVSRREYLCDAKFTLAIRTTAHPLITLDALEAAIKKPHYTPFLGRRACPLTRPLWGMRVQADTFETALEQIEPRQEGVIYSEWLDANYPGRLERDVPVRDSKRQYATRHIRIKAQRGETAHVSQ